MRSMHWLGVGGPPSVEIVGLSAERGSAPVELPAPRSPLVLASHDPHIAARSQRLTWLRDGAVVDDNDLANGYSVEDVIRRASQFG